MGGSRVAELVNAATNENLKEMDWTKSIEICELVARDQGLAKDVIKSIKKRLGKKNPHTQLFGVMLLEMLMNNCGDHIHKQVIDNGLLPILVKIVKKKTDLPVRERIFLLLDATQTALGGASSKFPQYYTAYYDLVSARVQFPQRPNIALQELASNVHEKEISTEDSLYQKSEADKKNANGQIIPDSSILHKASSVSDVLMEVLDAVNPQHPEGATDEFVLDLVEQCSFQKQRVMHLIMTSRDEKIVTQAIDLNDRLHKALAKHDALLSVRATSTVPITTAREDSEEEDEERLFRRIRKGKACAEDYSGNSSRSFMSIPAEKMKRPLCIQPADSDSKPPVPTSIPPPPAKHMERERFFKEKQADGSTLSGHMRGLSLHSRNGSSSRGGSSDFSERDVFGFRD